MVLQRDRPVPVWGTARPEQAVAVEFSGQRKEAKTSAGGTWRVDLNPLPASASGQALVVYSGTTPVRRFEDVLVGEVWLASGQSNMAWTVSEGGVSVKNAAAEIASAHFPLIRQLKIPKRNTKEPQTGFQAEWTVCSPETVGGFSGVAYFFARELFQKLNVPIGIINSSYGGTPIEAWLSGETFASAPACAGARQRFAETEKNWPEILSAYRAEKEAWTREAEAAKASGTKLDKPMPRQPVGAGHPYSPVTVYNAMLHPLVPYALRGVIWYQGEANVKRAGDYESVFAAMIRQWREEWGQGDFPFYFVQLANYRGDDPTSPDWAWLREAQSRALALPNTGMAVAIDIGDPNDIHPRNKQDAGRRLALVALDRTYKVDAGESSGPVLAKSRRVQNGLELQFDHGNGLLVKDPRRDFEIAGSDRKFFPASAEVVGNSVLVSAPEVKDPVAVRYAWANAPVATLFNAAGLPAAPFRTDDWPRETHPLP